MDSVVGGFARLPYAADLANRPAMDTRAIHSPEGRARCTGVQCVWWKTDGCGRDTVERQYASNDEQRASQRQRGGREPPQTGSSGGRQ